MAIIYSYPEIPEVQGGDLLLISDTGAPNKPTRSVDIDDLAAYIGTVVGVVQNLQSVLTVGNTYVNTNGYGTFTLNDTANDDGSITFVNPNEGWGYQISAEEGINITDGSGTNLMSIYSSGLSIRDGVQTMNIGTNALTATRNVYFPDASGTIALTSDIPSPGPSGSGTTNYTARWTSASALGIGALYDNGADVGIGINGTYTDPPQRLTVVSDDDIQPVAQFKNIGNGGGLFVRTDSTTRPLLELFSGSSYRFVVKGTGDVGIGTTSPSEKLEVNGNITVADEGEIYIQGSTSARKIVRLDNTNDKGLITLDRGDATRVSISSDLSTHGHTYFNGLNVNVGIGTTSPSAKLHLADSTSGGNPSFILQDNARSGAAALNYISLTDSLNANQAKIGYLSGLNTDLTLQNLVGNTSLVSSSQMKITAGTNTIFENSGSEKMRIASSGNVGIGTTSPSSKFQVSANDGDGITLKHGTSNAFYILRDGNDDTIIKQTRNYTSKISISTLADSGTHESSGLNIVGQGSGLKSNVGIGTASPSNKLHVNGDIRQQGSSYSVNITGGTSINGNNHLDIAANGSYLNLRSPNNSIFYRASSDHAFRDAGGSNEYLRIKTSGTTAGNVGIGTTSPDSLLEISTTDGTKNFVKLTSGAGGVNPALVFEKSAAEQGVIQYIRNGDLKIYNTDNDGGVMLSGSSATNYDMYINNSGNVGIGTTSPSNVLTIETDSNAKGIDFDAGGTRLGSIERMTIGSAVSIGLEGANGRPVSINNNHDSQVIIANGGGNVGIGTISPSQKLEVAGNIQATGSRSISASYDANHYMRIESNTNGGVIKGTDGGVITTLVRTYGDSYLNGGNVGIGTTSPSHKLTVPSGTNGRVARLGNLEITTQAATYSGSSIEVTGSNSFIKYNSTLGHKFFTRVQGGGNTLEALTIVPDTGNVGIGTTSPTANFHVTGNSSSANLPIAKIKSTGSISYLKFFNSSTGTGSSDGTYIGMNGGTAYFINKEAGNLYLGTGDDINLTLQNGGNVGIGTTSPNAKLNVNGNVKIEGENELYFGGSGSVPSWEIKASGSDLVINDTGSNVGSVLFNNDEGVVLPRLTTTEINAISLPNTGLTVYNTTLNTLCFYNGSSWQKVSHANM